MSDTHHILRALHINGDGTAKPLTGGALSEGLRSNDLAWVHLDANHAATKPWLEAELSYLDPFIVYALLEDETRPRCSPIGDGAIIILRGVNFNDGQDEEDMVSVRMFIDADRIISLQKRPVRGVQILADQLFAGRGPRNSGEFLTQLLTQLTNGFQGVLTQLDDDTDATEEDILTAADTHLRQNIINIRKKSIIFRRHLSPQREAISQLRLSDLSWLSDIDRRSLLERYNLTLRYVEDLDAIRERAQIVKDELANMISDRLNKNTYVLSVIAAIFLPLGFLTGLLGINIGGIPGSNNGSAFLIFCTMLIVLVACQIVIFKKLKWF